MENQAGKQYTELDRIDVNHMFVTEDHNQQQQTQQQLQPQLQSQSVDNGVTSEAVSFAEQSVYYPSSHSYFYSDYVPNNISQPDTWQKEINDIKRDHATINSKLDFLINVVQKIDKKTNVFGIGINDELKKIEAGLPLKTVEDVNKLERRLSNTEYYRNFKNVLCMHVGTRNENGSGLNNAYRLVDKVFDRKLLLEYTWTGATKGGKKHPFIGLANTLKVFFETVHITDSSISSANIENFFQDRVLKHAKQRAQRSVSNTTIRKTVARQKRKNVNITNAVNNE